MAKKKSNAEKAAGSQFQRTTARRLLDLILSDKSTRTHLEARLEHVPTKGAFEAVELGACRRNQKFLDFLMEDLRRVWYGIDIMDKQGDILDQPAKEARLKARLLGEDGDAEFGEDDDLALSTG